ncbi:MAG: hypothetical protein KDK10_11390, partial [Maritimibacter sp.]|nr:hypothetical protein [Maritimibacter sp.]
QYRETMERARYHLEQLRRQRDELDEAIRDLAETFDWGARMLETMDHEGEAGEANPGRDPARNGSSRR